MSNGFQGSTAKNNNNKSSKNTAVTNVEKRSQLLNEIDILNDIPVKVKATIKNSDQQEQKELNSIAEGSKIVEPFLLLLRLLLPDYIYRVSRLITNFLFVCYLLGGSITINTPEQAAAFRKSKRIRVYGTDIPNPFSTFENLSAYHNLKPLLYKNIRQSKYTSPTAIQMQSIPIILHGRDLMACAPTGSGKTLAYLLPMLQDLEKPSKLGYRGLIIAPTRELTQQVIK